MTLVQRRLSSRTRSAQPLAAPPTSTLPVPDPQTRAARTVQQHTTRPVRVQRAVVQPVLRAASLERQEVQRVQHARLDTRSQIAALGVTPQEISAAVQRQSAEPTALPARPSTPGEWVTVMRQRAAEVQGHRLDARQAADFTALQRQVAGQLALDFRRDTQKAQARHDAAGEHLATLRGHPLSAPVAEVALGQLPPSERAAVQRATELAVQRHAAQTARDAQAMQAVALQRQLAELDHEATQPVFERIQARRGQGNPLPAAVQRHLEQGLNHDLSRVRIHDDTEADRLARGVNATAFTTGADIFFRAGRFDPNSRSGLELLAHEVTHTVQQSKGQVGKGIDPDAGLESEARQMGNRLSQFMPSPKSLMPHSLHAPGVYTKGAALQRAQDGAAQYFALKPLYDLQPRTVQRFSLGDLNPVNLVKKGAEAIGDGAAALASKAKDAVLSAVKAIPGYKELSMAFGKDIVTGAGLGSSPEAILNALANWVPGPLKDIIKALRETNVIGKAWAWFQGQLGKLDLGGVLGEVKDAVLKLPPDLGKAKAAVTRRISGLMGLIRGSAQKIAEIGLTALTAGLGPLGKKIMASLKGAGDVIVKVLKDPVAFAKHLVEAVKGGFKQFAANAPKHLQNGIGQWLTGASGITFPARFDLQGVFMVALTVMGLTYQNLRGKLVRALGPGGSDKVSKAETTIDALKSVRGGLQHASEVKGQQGAVGTAIQDGIKSEVTKSLVLAGIQKVVTMLVPGGGFINAIIGAFQTVQTVIQQGAQIAQVVTSALGSIGAIAAGNIGSAVGLIDRTLGGAIPVALAWLGKVVGLGNLGGKIKGIIVKVRGKLDSVVDRLVGKVKGLIDKVFGKGKDGKKPGEDRDTPDSKKVKADVRSYMSSRLPKKFKNVSEVSAVLQSAYTQFKPRGLKALKTQRKGVNFSVFAKASPYENVGLTQAEIMFDLDDLDRMVRQRGVVLKAKINGVPFSSTNTAPTRRGEVSRHAEENFVRNAETLIRREGLSGAEVTVQLSSSPCGDPGCDAELQQKLHNCAQTLIEFSKRNGVKLKVQILGLYTPQVKTGKQRSRDGLKEMLEQGIRIESWTPDVAIAQIRSNYGELDAQTEKSIRSKLRNAIKELERLSGLNLGTT